MPGDRGPGEMKRHRLIFRPLAEADLFDLSRHVAKEGGQAAASACRLPITDLGGAAGRGGRRTLERNGS
jgi:hypothetical protein